MGSTGVVFADQSTSAAARRMVADALRTVDPVGAAEAERDTDWRRGYLSHFVRLLGAGLTDPADAVRIARDGLSSAAGQFRFEDGPLGDALSRTAEESSGDQPVLRTVSVTGAREPERDLTIPYRGKRLAGDDLTRQLDDWVTRGIITQSCAEAVRRVQQNPQWLSLDGDTLVLLGAGAELGPYRSLLRWGARVAAVDLQRDDVSERLTDQATASAGTALLPARDSGSDHSGRGALLGANLLHELPAVTRWLEDLPGDRLVVGNYCYADGGTHVRLSMAADAIASHLVERRPGTALAFLATPTDAFAVGPEEIKKANARYDSGSRLLRAPLRALSAGRLLRRNYPPGVDQGVCDSLVPQQGPNYALAKRLQRWRATVARADGATVSLNVAPATRTRSVLKNRALAAAYAGAHRFGVEVFDPATSNVLMAALLVHDLRAEVPVPVHPADWEAHQGAHGGLWTAAYHPRSALTLAAVLGVGALRG